MSPCVVDVSVCMLCSVHVRACMHVACVMRMLPRQVQHGKNNHWKVAFKHGIMNVDGRDYVFGKAAAEWDW